jgi:exoribonuclease-2
VVSFAAVGRQPAVLPLRDLDLIAAVDHPDAGTGLPGGAAAPLGRWGVSRETLAASLPPRRDLAMAWVLLQEQTSTSAVGLTLTQLAELFGSPEDIGLRASLWLWLQGEQSWFRWRQQQAEPRPLAELRQLRLTRYRQRLQQQRQQSWQRQICARRPLDRDALDPSALRDLDLLQRWAASDCSSPLPESLLACLHQTHCPPEPGAIRHLLVDLGQWLPHQLPSLQASPWQIGFPQHLLDEAEALVGAADHAHPGDDGRLDLCHLHSFSIDDEDTLDIDDALALEELEGGDHALWVHIADPGRLVIAGSGLDLEARRRGSSLYLAQGTLPMFPPVLGHGPFSLRQGQRSAAWSLRVQFDREGAVRESRLVRSWIRPSYRLSYADADDLIELAPPQERAPALLHDLLERRRRWRERRGALCLEQAEGRIRCRGEHAELQVVEPSPSRRMVAEAMILAGAVIAELGRREGLVLPYRSQLPATLPSATELAALDPGPVRHAAIKRCLSRGHVGVTPAPHFSLGLDAYVQATSPIRRYGDLLVQRQLAAWSGGGETLDGAAMAALLELIDGPVREGIRISREDQRHWLQVWFEQNPQPSWSARFLRWLRPQDQLALVHLEELSLELPATCPAGCEPGMALRLRVVQVDSLRDQLRLQAGP